MDTNLYEALGVPTTATPEQIRKAYKKRALQTHPDRLPPSTSPEEKANSEDLFRKINNAYEILSDPQNRRLYDQHGVWPPPEAPMPQNQSGFGSQTQPPAFNPRDGFFPDQWGNRSSFGFTDPFALFDAMFDAHGFSNSHRHRHHYERPWFASQLSRMMNDDDDSRHHQNFGLMNFPSFFGFNMFSIPPPPPFFGTGNGGQWQVESYSSTTINGVTTTSHQRRDWNGNEQVTHSYSDGRNVHTVDGVPQPRISQSSRHVATHEHHSGSASPTYPSQGHIHQGHGASRTRAMIEDRPHQPRYQRWYPDPAARPGDHFASPRYDPIQIELPREKRGERH